MVFLREGGKDELSLLLEHGRGTNTRSVPIDVKGKGRATEQTDAETHGEANIRAVEPVETSKSKAEPTDSLLHRLAGPSTGKAGLKRE